MDFDEEQGKELITVPSAPHNGVSNIEPELLPLIPEISAGSSFLNTLYADLLAKAVVVLKTQGILSESHLKAALITLIATNSALLGDPLVAVLSAEDETRAMRVLDVVRKLTPDEFIIEFSNFNPNTLLAGNNPFKSKTILGLNSKGFKKGSEDLLALVERSTWTQHHLKAQGQDKVVKKSQSFGPTAWVSVAGDDNDLLHHPSVLKIPIETEMESARDRLLYMAGQSSNRSDASEAYDLIKTGFRRLSHCRVEIPFAQELATFIADSNIADADSKFRIILYILSNVVRINNSPAVTEEEARHRLIGHPVRVVMKDPLTATRQDYYLFWLLMDGLLPTGMDGVTSREQRVFNAIKTWAFGDADGILVQFGNSNRERLVTVQANTSRWSDKERISEALCKDGGEKLSSSSVHRILKDLVEKKLAIERKDPTDGNNKRLIYQIDTLSIDTGLKLPHPSAIPDPLNPAGTTHVLNPITGQNETI